jgi:hypothetical protein
VIGVLLGLVSIGLAIPIINTYLEEGIVPHLLTAVLSTGLMIRGGLVGVVGARARYRDARAARR